MKNFKRFLFIGMFIFGILALVGCSQTSTDKPEGSTPQQSAETAASNWPKTLRLSASVPGGANYTLGVAVNEALKKDLPPDITMSVDPGGGFTTPVMVNDGQAEFGFGVVASMSDAYNGIEPFKKPLKDVRAMVTWQPQTALWSVLKDSGITSVEDLRGKTVSSGPKGLSNEFWTKQMFEVYGMKDGVDYTYKQLAFDDVVENMKNRMLDAFPLAVTGAPFAPYGRLVDISSTRDLDFLQMDSAKLDEYMSKHPGWYPITVPSETLKKQYGVDKEMKTIYTPLVIIVKKDLPDDLVYQMTKTLNERLSEIAEAYPALKNLTLKDQALPFAGVPYHPGAMKYWKEKGIEVK